MSRLSDIIDRVRDSLADPDADRFSDTRLIRLAHEAQEKIAIATKILREEALMQLVPGTSILVLPKDCILISRVIFGSTVLKFTSHDELDEKSSTWMEETANEPTHAIYSLRSPNRLQLWPAIEYPELAEYGLVTSLGTTTVATDLGASQSIPGSVEIGNTSYGIIATISVPTYSVRLYYARRSAKLLSLDSELEIPEAFDSALVHYIISFALRDNIDVSSRSLATEEYQFAVDAMQTAAATISIDSSASQKYNTSYAGGLWRM